MRIFEEILSFKAAYNSHPALFYLITKRFFFFKPFVCFWIYAILHAVYKLTRAHKFKGHVKRTVRTARTLTTVDLVNRGMGGGGEEDRGFSGD